MQAESADGLNSISHVAYTRHAHSNRGRPNLQTGSDSIPTAHALSPQLTLDVKAEPADGLEVYGGLVQQGVSNGEQQPRSFRGRKADVVRYVGSVVRIHHLF